MKKIVVASSNQHKIEEIRNIIKNVEIIPWNEIIDHFEVEEDQDSFKGNAYKKAKALYDLIKMPVISDDSGLCVSALDQKPGVYSSRFMGEDCSYDIKNQYIIDKCKEKEDYKAKFVSVICYIDEKEEVHFFEGVLEGTIYHQISGNQGFGYDPIFYLKSHQKTLAQLSFEEKNKVSHRFLALQKFKEFIYD